MASPVSKKKLIKKDAGRKAAPAKKRAQTPASFVVQAKRNQPLGKQADKKEVDLLCTGCGAIYFDKHWHSAALAGGVDRKNLAEALCEECRLGSTKDGAKVLGWGGEVTLEGLNDPALRAEVIGLARNVGKRAAHRDPEDRIIKIAVSGKNVVVYTTENQLAVSVGKQVHSARKGGELSITWSRQDKPVRVRWTAPKE